MIGTKEIIAWVIHSIELLAVLVIATGIVFGTGRFLYHFQQQQVDSYNLYKAQLAKALLIGLELLVAADIIGTVVLNPSLIDVVILSMLVLIRTFLSWSLVLEIEGRWPWQRQSR